MTRSSAVSQNTTDLHRLLLSGWWLVGVLLCAWGGWLSLLAIANGTAVQKIETREAAHFEQLHHDLQEVKRDVKELLSRQRLSETHTPDPR